MTKQGYLPDENIPESTYLKNISEIVELCEHVLVKYPDIEYVQNYIKAGYYDEIREEIRKWDER